MAIRGSLVGRVHDQRIALQPLSLQSIQDLANAFIDHCGFRRSIHDRRFIVERLDRGPGSGAFANHQPAGAAAHGPGLQKRMNRFLRKRWRVLLVIGGVAIVRLHRYGGRQHVRPVVSEQKKKWLIGRLLRDEVHGSPRPKGRQMFRAAIAFSVIDDGFVIKRCRMAAWKCHPEIEAELRFLMGAKVILADQGSAVAGIFQRLRQVAEFLDRRPVVDIDMGWQCNVNAGLRRQQSRQQCGSRWRADPAYRECLLEFYALCGKSIDMWRENLGIAVGAEQCLTLIIRDNQYDVREICSDTGVGNKQ